jgi:hypothetical protein
MIIIAASGPILSRAKDKSVVLFMITKRSQGHTGVSVKCFRFMQLSNPHWFDRCYGGEPMLMHYPNLD